MAYLRRRSTVARAESRRGRLIALLWRAVGSTIAAFAVCATIFGPTPAQAATLTVGAPTADPTTAAVRQTVTFTAPASVLLNNGAVDPDTSLSYAWNFGDGATAEGPTVTHAFSVIGTWDVTVTVTDSDGNEGVSGALPIDVIPLNPTPTTPAPGTAPRPKTETAKPLPVRSKTKTRSRGSGHSHPSPSGSGTGGGSGGNEGSGSGGVNGSGSGSAQNAGPLTQPSTPGVVPTPARKSVPVKKRAKVNASGQLVGVLVSAPVTPNPTPRAAKSASSAGGGGAGRSVGVIGWVVGILLAVGLMARGGWVAYEPRARYRRLAAT